ncbi:hypothetical protein GALMADRAFT_241715 [Galerina marginata CBS 339.88]|uniref:Uncharacterized protein n=1 Tax=Galerina marginata (strain CBS 339.88) TaxID=685588 RepID=A0A067TD65_GALM3|nr:hypothetical protein GALMADRAFT_241715 [Galerina marginata CBS 339.88]
MPGLRWRFFAFSVITSILLWYTPIRGFQFLSERPEGCLGYEGGRCLTDETDLCSNPQRGQCGFYRDCLEARFHCGPEGYPLGYGEKYCEKFSNARDTLSSAGQVWMLDTMQCLQRALVPEVTSELTQDLTALSDQQACDALKEKAFSSHPGCYVDSGVCTLGLSDWTHIVKIINFSTLFGSWDAVKQALETVEECLELYRYLLDHHNGTTTSGLIHVTTSN